MIRVAGGLQAFRKAYRLVGVISPYRILTRYADLILDTFAQILSNRLNNKLPNLDKLFE